jgi:hypothetical protein
MKLLRVISTGLLFLLLGTTAFVYAQRGPKEKGGGGQKAQQAQPAQHQQQAQRTQRTQHTQQAQRTQRPQRTQQAQQRGKQQGQRAAYNRGNNGSYGNGNSGRQQGQRVAYNRGNNGFHGNGNNGNHYGRIPDDRFRAHFGRGHSFRMNRPRLIAGYQRFQYSGYWFGYNDPWPSGWYYTDDVYVDYVGGAYYLYNPRHPGIYLTLNLF